MDYNKLKHIVYTPDVKETDFINSSILNGINCIEILDARSAVYTATGISAQTKELVVVCLRASNSSRSAFSGMTEAFYRKLPVILVTYGTELDYSVELADVIRSHFVVSYDNQIFDFLDKPLPMHLEVQLPTKQLVQKDCIKIQKVLKTVLTDDVYLYLGQGIDKQEISYNCKVVEGGMSNCYEGSIANVLGASLAKKHRRYIGLISEEEFTHDMNTLGNINVNDSLMFIVAIDEMNLTLENYAESLGFRVFSEHSNIVEESFIKNLVDSNNKTVLFVLKED
ncbi:thiamine pyrophosphate-binding protein [Longibaculum muris]|uniref:thiamine pyrophosphate-binding protein n=1 Tax=Longibaculum muris TaxID=1796628 RepID=UPI0012B94B45|nr:thiamine pyrophosphate-binding protein [Longibaculum muris]